MDIISRSATPYWKAVNIRLLTVFEPAMKAPSAPVMPAKNGHTSPTFAATQSAITRGIESRPASLTSELM